MNYDDVIKRASLKSKEKVPLTSDKVFTDSKLNDVEMHAVNGGEVTINGVQPRPTAQVKIYTVIDIFRNKHVLMISLILAFTWYVTTANLYLKKIKMYEGCSEINETLARNRLFKNLKFLFLVDI